MLSWLLSNVRRVAVCVAGMFWVAAAAPAQPPPSPTMICVCTTPTPVPTPAPTYSCIDERGARTSEASPLDGAVYRVGEPVLIDTDPEYATAWHCHRWPFPFVGRMIISRTVGQTGEDGIGISSFRDSHDRPVTLRFNVPGTVRIVREARSLDGIDGIDYWLEKRNVITIIDDGPIIYPPPTPAPPPTGPQPGIRISDWRGTPPTYHGPGLITRDGEIRSLIATAIENTSDEDLILLESHMWISNGSSILWLKNVRFPLVVRPGQTRVLEYDIEVVDWHLYERSSHYSAILIHTNYQLGRFLLISPYPPQVYEDVNSIPDGTTYPPSAPILDDPSICNDSNNDGHIDASDIVHSLLGRE